MKNQLRYFFPLIVCVAIVAGGACRVPAQTVNPGDKILVAGKQQLRQSDMDKIIEFYEWAFEADFSANERARFQELSIVAFQRDVATSRKDADSLISALAKVRARDQESQAKARQMFNEGFAKDLRAADDEASRLLLGIYERGRGGDKSSAVAEVLPREETKDTPKSSSGGGAVPRNLVGRWTRSGGAGGATDGTGKTRYNSGTDSTFEFFADGTMQFLVKKETLSILQCRISETTKIPGRFTVSGDQLTMNLGAGTVVGTNSCEAAGNFKKTLTGSTLAKKFVVKEMESVFRPDRPLILCLDGSADDACFEREIK